MPALTELPPDQERTSPSEVSPWESLPRVDFSSEEAETCLLAFETYREATDEETRMAAWEKINFFLLKAQAQGILEFPRGLGQKKTTGSALRHLPLEERDSLGNFRYPQFRAIVDWEIREGKIEKTTWDNYHRRKGKFTLAEIGKILGVSRERVRQWILYEVRALRHPSRARKLHDHCLAIARPEEWEKVKRERGERKIRDIRSMRGLLSTRSLHTLLKGGILTIPQVLSLSEEELQAIRYLGPVLTREIRQAFEQYLERLSPEMRSKLESEALELPKAKISRRGKITFPKTERSSGA